MELLFSIISIVAYFFGYPTVAGIVGIVATLLFILFYSKQDKSYVVFVPWLIISILLNILFIMQNSLYFYNNIVYGYNHQQDFRVKQFQ